MNTPELFVDSFASHSRWPARLACAALAMLLLASTGCGAARSTTGRGAESDRAPVSQGAEDGDARAAATAGVRLTLTIAPRIGDAPLTVALHVALEGDLDDPDRFSCATAAFAFGDDNVQLIPPPDGCADTVQRTYGTEHTYAAAGSYRATVRLIARPVSPSKPVQVLVRGATPTAVPMAANPGPTIVIATPGVAFPAAAATPAPHRTVEQVPATATAAPTSMPATRVAALPPATARVPSSTLRAASPSSAPTSAPLAASSPPPTPGQHAVLAVLPADLYYLGGNPPRLWRLPASGDEPEALDPPAASTDGFAVSSIGFIARSQGGGISVQSPTGSARTVATSGDRESAVGAPVWSRDGHVLAYTIDGRLSLFDVVTFQEHDMGMTTGAPLSFSRDGRWLLVGGDEQPITLVDVESGDARPIPSTDGDAGPLAGWLPDRNVLWQAGAGLRFVTVQDPLTVTSIIAPDVRTSSLLVRSDGKAFLLIERAGRAVLAAIDLDSPTIRADTIGAPLSLAVDSDMAWAPDGRTLAVAGPDGLALVDPATGARVPLVEGPAAAPVWMISSRRMTDR